MKYNVYQEFSLCLQKLYFLILKASLRKTALYLHFEPLLAYVSNISSLVSFSRNEKLSNDYKYEVKKSKVEFFIEFTNYY